MDKNGRKLEGAMLRRTPNEKLYAHFVLTSGHYVTKEGKHHTNIPLCLCAHCSTAHKAGRKLEPPEPLKRTKRACEGHLKNCPHAPSTMKAPGAFDTLSSVPNAPAVLRPYDPETAAAEVGVQPGSGAAVIAAMYSGAAAEDPFQLPDKKRRRTFRNEVLYSHFTLTNEKYSTTQGRTHEFIYRCICNYCADAYAAAIEKNDSANMQPPQSIVRSKRNCENHLRGCRHAPQGLIAAKNPSHSTETASLMSNYKKLPVTSTTAKASPAKGTALIRHQDIKSMDLNVQEKDVLKKAVVEFIVCADLPFEIVENPAFRSLLESARPKVSRHIPDRDQTAGALLMKCANEAQETASAEIKAKLQAGRHLGLVLEGRKDVGSSTQGYNVWVNTGNRTLLYDCRTSSGQQESHGIAIAKEIESTMNIYNHVPHGLEFSYCCSSDATGEQGRARQILALRHPQMLWRRCFAFQINQLLRTLLSVDSFQQTLKTASVAAWTLANTENRDLALKLSEAIQQCQPELYVLDKPTYIECVKEKQWSSIHDCFASMLRVKPSCATFANENSSNPEFPATILEEWNSYKFWSSLEEAEKVFRPLASASSWLRTKEGNNMADVMAAYLDLYQHFAAATKSPTQSMMLSCLQEFWNRHEEHHLLFLAYALHPKNQSPAVALLDDSERRHGNWTDDRNPLTRARLQQAAKFYYRKFNLYKVQDKDDRNKEELRLVQRMGTWLKGKSLEGVYEPVEGWEAVVDAVEFWLPYETEHNAFVRLAKFLLGAPVQTASCEDLITAAQQQHCPRALVPPDLYKRQMQIRYGPGRIRNHTSMAILTDVVVGRDSAQVEAWMDSLLTAIPTVSFPETFAAAMQGHDDDNDGESEDEADDDAKPAAQLDALPDTDDPSYPTENEELLSGGSKSRVSVRTDKLSLAGMAAGLVNESSINEQSV